MRACELTRPISEPRMLVTPATYATTSKAGAAAFSPSMKGSREAPSAGAFMLNPTAVA